MWLRYIHLFHELRQQQQQYSVCTYTQKHHMPQSAAILIAYMHIHLYRLASTQSPRQQQRPRTKTTTTTKTTTLPYVDHEHILELARVFNDACNDPEGISTTFWRIAVRNLPRGCTCRSAIYARSIDRLGDYKCVCHECTPNSIPRTLRFLIPRTKTTNNNYIWY